jgi:hypothetical protein
VPAAVGRLASLEVVKARRSLTFPILVILGLALLSGCGPGGRNPATERQEGASGGTPWARFMIENSNGVTKHVTCPGTRGCGRLRRSLDGKLFSYVPRYEEDPEIASGSIDLTDPEFKPKRLPGFDRNRIGPPRFGKWPAAEGVPCFIERTGEETIRVKGTIRGRDFAFRRNQKDSCQSQEYGLWNELFETDSTSGGGVPGKPGRNQDRVR